MKVVQLSAPRTHGYQTKGQRSYDKHDWHCRKSVNAIGAIFENRFITVSLFEGPINSDVFYHWIKEDLLPKLPSGCVIVMDNAAFHKRQDIHDAIKAKGCFTQWLPAYSPEFNPIEKKWAQCKARRRKHRCDVDTLFKEYLDYVEMIH